jgi:hypothetical protein
VKDNGVNQKKSFKDLKLSNNLDIVIEAIIPSKVISIEFKMEGKIMRKDPINLTASKIY